jgi:hypothetical protein
VCGVACLVYGGYSASKVVELRQRYGDDDRILIQWLHAVSGLVLGLVVVGWAAGVLRGGQPPTGTFYRARPGEWSGWMVAVGVALLGVLLAFGYDGARGAADQYRASGGRGVHGALSVTACRALEDGYECEGTFRADDGSFEVERVSAWPAERPRGTLGGWVSGPRPLGMFDGSASGWRQGLIPLGVLAAGFLTVAGLVGTVVTRRIRRAG